MPKNNIDYERLCNAIGITDSLRELFAMEECIPSLVDDIHTYANYDEIAMEHSDRNIPMEESKEFYGMRILNALEIAFYGKSKEDISIAVYDIIAQ